MKNNFKEDIKRLDSLGQKVIIFTNNLEDTKVVCKILSENIPTGFGCITGETSPIERVETIKDFIFNEHNFLVGTISTLGTGVDLTDADWILFIKEPFILSQKTQAICRAYRPGREKPLYVRTYINDAESKDEILLPFLDEDEDEDIFIGEIK